MGWNGPDKGKDPWGGKSQPPDLDEALKRLQDKLKKMFMRGSEKLSTSESVSESGPSSSGSFLAMIVFFCHLYFMGFVRDLHH